MDIIDVLLARAKSFTGETKTLVKQAQQAMADANEVVDRVSEIEDAAQTASEQAAQAAEQAADAMEIFSGLEDDLETTVSGLVDDRVQEVIEENYVPQINSKSEVHLTNTSTNSANIYTVTATAGSTTENSTITHYKATGQNQDGSMTQKAITDALDNQKTELIDMIDAIPAGGGSGGNYNFDAEDAGHLVIVGENGDADASTVTEEDLIKLEIASGTYQPKNAIGVEIDYVNKTVTRIYDAVNLTPGADFDNYNMYQRRRVTVQGQTMVLQPAFYYLRIIEEVTNGVIRKEKLLLSDVKQAGFKLHPAFINDLNEPVDFIYLSAYEGSVFDVSANTQITNDAAFNSEEDLLCSVPNVKPVSGINSVFTVQIAEQMASRRGVGWHIETSRTLSVNQMLFMVEYASLNAQNALGLGICKITDDGINNYSSLTGSTNALGNASGAAEQTINETLGVRTIYNTPNTVAISYRGVENLWGNIWKFLADVRVYHADGFENNEPYVCVNSNYSDLSNYTNMGFRLPENSSWISAMGYPSNENFDWTYFPIECSGANSAVPVGDFFWSPTSTNASAAFVYGGYWGSDLNNGLFNYACDKSIETSARGYSARLIYVPRAIAM